jgi:hypothetical protein
VNFHANPSSSGPSPVPLIPLVVYVGDLIILEAASEDLTDGLNVRFSKQIGVIQLYFVDFHATPRALPPSQRRVIDVIEGLSGPFE